MILQINGFECQSVVRFSVKLKGSSKLSVFLINNTDTNNTFLSLNLNMDSIHDYFQLFTDCLSGAKVKARVVLLL